MYVCVFCDVWEDSILCCMQCHPIDLILVLSLSSLSLLSLHHPSPSLFPRQHVAFGYITVELTACLCMCVHVSVAAPGLGKSNTQLSGLASIQIHVNALLIVLTVISARRVCVCSRCSKSVYFPRWRMDHFIDDDDAFLNVFTDLPTQHEIMYIQ